MSSTPSPASKPSPRRALWRWMAAFWLVQAALMYGLTGPILGGFSDPLDAWADSDYALVMLVTTAVVTVAQALFILPVRKPTLAPRGKSLFLSLAIAGAAVALMGAAFVGAVVEAFVLADPWLEDVIEVPRVMVIAACASWLVATPLLWIFTSRSNRDTMLSRLAARLFLGTIVEVAAVIPIDVIVRRRTDCYCQTGTFFALIACGVVAWFAAGPAVFLPLLAARRRRWRQGHCDACGYDMNATLKADRCPECGAGWAPPLSEG